MFFELFLQSMLSDYKKKVVGPDGPTTCEQQP